MRSDLTGKRFGKLVVIGLAGIVNRKTQWTAVCDCGNKTIVAGSTLNCGNTKSCGCLRREIGLINGANRKTHGMSKTPTYSSWKAMHSRCYKKSDISYRNYGGRGIKVCARWNSFDIFWADMGTAPEGMSIDREQINGDYEPSNCKWSTNTEQGRNTRVNRIINAFGKSLPLASWAEIYGTKPDTIAKRLDRGFDAETAISKPTRVYSCQSI